MTFEAHEDDEPTIAKSRPKLDLAGVPGLLKSVMEAYAALDVVSIENEIAAARRVSTNDDGSVNVQLLSPVKTREEEHTDIRLRPIRGRDYFDGTTRNICESSEFGDTIELAAKLLSKAQQGAIDAIDNYDDLKAVYFGVVLTRKNFARPRK